MRLILICQDMLHLQNNRYWSSENPHALIQLPLYDHKTSIWCVISANHIIGPIFYEELLMLNTFFINFAPAEDSVILCKMARLHTQLRNLTKHYMVFGELNGDNRIISKVNFIECILLCIEYLIIYIMTINTTLLMYNLFIFYI
jgi:hypothetical protein